MPAFMITEKTLVRMSSLAQLRGVLKIPGFDFPQQLDLVNQGNIKSISSPVSDYELFCACYLSVLTS